MNTTTENPLNLTKLCDGRDGIRAMLPVTVINPRNSAGMEPTSSAKQPSDSQRSTLNAQPAVLQFVASTGAIDRYQEIIEPEGWILDNYRKNPVFQNAHRYGDVLFTLGKATWIDVREIAEGKKALCMEVEFAIDINPVSRIAFGLYDKGYIKGVSTGLIPTRWEEGTATTPWRRRYLEQELLEVSAVAIPANPEALMQAYKSGALFRADVEEALELVRLSIAASSAQQPSASQLSTINSQLLLARELRNIMRA